MELRGWWVEHGAGEAGVGAPGLVRTSCVESPDPVLREEGRLQRRAGWDLTGADLPI